MPRAKELPCEQQLLVRKSMENSLSHVEILKVLRYCDDV